MLSAKIKDEPVNQMVSCKSSFAFEERNEERGCRDLGVFRYEAPVCPWGAGGEAVTESSRWVYMGFVWGLTTAHSSARVSLEGARI